MRKLALILALAALLLPGLALADTPKAPEPAPQSPVLGLEQALLGGSCAAAQPEELFSPPGCPRPCKVDTNCRYYPEEVCINGCCAF
jgi:hypothetical protein